MEEKRIELWDNVESLPDTDFRILVRSPRLVMKFIPWNGCWPSNVWMGVKVADQATAERVLPELTSLPAPVRFVYIEQLRGPIDLAPWCHDLDWVSHRNPSSSMDPSEPGWLHDVRDQCVAAHVAFELYR
ncbi:DUF5131 family protein [Altererythrobacter sp.]|nr:DUF5131 family protein [Altererythrobacter sp.]